MFEDRNTHYAAWIDKRRNPYTPGAGLRPPKLAGREQDIEDLAVLVERLRDDQYERSLIYSGLRGVGKTVLLLEFDALATEAGWATSEVAEVGSQPDFRLTFSSMAMRVLTTLSLKHRVKARAQKALRVVQSFNLTAGAPGGVQLNLGIEPAKGVADSGDPERDLSELLREVGEVAASGRTGALFLVDEMQNLGGESLAAICLAFQDLSKRGLPVALVGAGLPDLPLRLFGAKPYADRLFNNRELGGLTEAQARTALVTPASRRKVKFRENAVEAVLAQSAGYPYFIQEYGREVWNFADRSPIAIGDVRAVTPVVRDRLARDFFGTRFELGTDTEQKYLAAMASLGEGPYRSRDVASAYGARSQRAVSLQRDGLIKKGLIWSPRRAYIDFTVPLFARFLRDTHPLDSFE